MDRLTYWDEESDNYMIKEEDIEYWQWYDYTNYIGMLEDRIEELENAIN